MSNVLPFAYVINIKIMSEIFYILFHIAFKTQCAFYAYSTSQSRLATFQVLNRCTWLVVTMIDKAALTDLLLQPKKS